MTSLQLPAFDGPRPQTQGASPAASPLPRPPQAAHIPDIVNYAQPGFRLQPGSLALPLPLPHHNFGNYPSTAPPLSFYPTGMYNPHMMRTVSHAHPMHSATDNSSSRYSVSPHSGGEAPPSATLPYTMNPSFNFTEQSTEKHIDPSVFNYPMSRSTSGGSDLASDGRLLTPHLDYRDSPATADFRRAPEPFQGKYWPRYEFGMGQPHTFFRPPMSADRDVKPEVQETDYERERAEQIMNNRKLLDDVGLGDSYMRARVQPRKVTKRDFAEEHPSRVSSRIASMHRTSYADLDGSPPSDRSEEDDYEEPQVDEEEFRPPKRVKGKRGYSRQISYAKIKSKVDLSLYGLLQVYPQIPHLFPLFYYTLNNDLTINSDSVPLIGSIPSTVTPMEKADTLRNFFHRGRRVLAQLDTFTSRCDRKYEGAEERWAELDFATRIAIRDVRRKIVERCENYKYTRRDLLDKVVGKNKWQPIDQGLIEWELAGEGDPANDLQNVTLTLPTPPIYVQQRQEAPYEGRTIRPFPSRPRIASAAPRTVSVQMNGPSYPVSTPSQAYFQPTSAPPMYGEDQVPMSVQMPGNAMSSAGPSSSITPAQMGWDEQRGMKRDRSDSAETPGDN